MPTLNIEGRKVTVDDSFLQLSPEDQQATVEEIASQLGISPSNTGEGGGLVDQFLGGLESTTEQPGISIEAGGKALGMQGVQDTGTWLRNIVDAPQNFESATNRFINPKQEDSYVDPVLGFGWGSLPGMAAENAGMLTGFLASRGTGAGIGAGLGAVGGFATGGPAGATAGAASGAVVGATVGPALLGFVSTVGPVALERARNANPPREEPTWEDWALAAGTAGLVGALDSIGIGKLGLLNSTLKNAGKTTTKELVKETAKDVGKSAARETAVGAGQSAIQQYGETAGTDKGATINLKRVVGEGIGQGLGGGIADIGRRAYSTTGVLKDSIAVDRSVAKDPFARDRAEITRDVNALDARPTQDGKELQSSEISSYVSDLKKQAAELIRKQNLAPDDRKALIDGLNDAKGLTEARLNEIAGRSESPNEIKAIARKVQLVRSMTVQQQARKGAKGWLASALRIGGIPLGYAIDSAVGSGGLAGSIIGGYIGRDLARDVSNRKTQGARIDALVGAKQARRAKLLLDRYGPSDATKAMNTLTERAAAIKAQADEEASILAQNAQQMQEFKAYQKQRAEMQKAIEQAKTREERDRKKAEKEKFDLAHRDLRLQTMAINKATKQARLQAIVDKLDQQKTLNALTVEMTKVKADLAQKTAEAKAQSLDRNAKFEVDNLRGRLEKLSLEIQKRQEALKKAQTATKNAEKAAAMTPAEKAKNRKVAKKAAEQSFKSMPVEQIADAKLDQFGNPINESTHYKEQKARIQNLEIEGLRAAENFPDKATGNLFIAAIRKFQTYKGRMNQAKRMDVLDEVQSKVDENDVEAQRFVYTYILPLAIAFDAETNQKQQYTGREDYGSAPDPEMDIPF